MTSAGGTKRNSALGSMNLAMSHGQAMRSIFGRSLVIHFMPAPPSKPQKQRDNANIPAGTNADKLQIGRSRQAFVRPSRREPIAAARCLEQFSNTRSAIAARRPFPWKCDLGHS